MLLGRPILTASAPLSSLAYAEMNLILARVVWNFDFELDPRSADWIEKNETYLLWEKPDLFVRLINIRN